LQCEKLIILQLCLVRNFQNIFDKVNILESNNASTQIFIQYEIKKTNHSIWFKLFSSNQWSVQAWPFRNPNDGMIHVLK
jgi:hypothetical protein